MNKSDLVRYVAGETGMSRSAAEAAVNAVLSGIAGSLARGEALECIERAEKAAQAASLPEIAISGGSGVTEGASASLTVTATPAPSSPLAVTLTVGQSGDFAASGQTGTRQVTVPTGGSVTVQVATVDDAVLEANGAVSATVTAGTGYNVAAVPGDTASVAVADDDTPVVSIAAGNGVTEGSPASFTVTASPAPAAPLTVALTVGQSGDYAAAGETGAREVTVPTGGSTTVQVATADDSADEPDGSVSVTVGAGTGYAVAASPGDTASVAVADDDAAPPVSELAIGDVTANESDRFMWFTVTLSPASDRSVRVGYQTRESDPVSARSNSDFVAVDFGDLTFSPGETSKRLWVYMFDDGHDEDPETFEVALSSPTGGARIADGVAVGTIVNNDPLPGAFLARFGRTVAEQALEGIAARMAAPRIPGMQGMVTGQALSFDPTVSGRPAAVGSAVLPRSAGSQTAPGSWSGAGFGSSGEESRTMTLREALSGSSFTLTGDVDGAGGTMAFWGQAPGAGGHAFATQFAGADRDAALRLSGETASALLGADYARGPWLVGFALSQSTSGGDYAQDGAGACSGQPEDVCALAAKAGQGEVEASLTATVPYAAYDVSERLRLWGAVGQGAGAVTVTTGLGGSYRADTRWSMAAAGLRGELLAPPVEGSGPSLAVVSDALWVRTTSEKTRDLAASESDVSRLRLGLEGSWGVALAGGASLTPKLELGARHDGGDAETGRGVELGGGLSWVDPGLGLTLDLSGRTLVAHDDSALEDRGVSASLVFAPDATGGRGPSFSLGQDWGGQAQGGLDALFAPAPLEEREDGGKLESRWSAEAAWGFPALGGRFTGSPHMGLGLMTGARDYTLGWRLAPEAANAPDVSFGVTATRRESDTAPVEHRLGIEATARW